MIHHADSPAVPVSNFRCSLMIDRTTKLQRSRQITCLMVEICADGFFDVVCAQTHSQSDMGSALV